VPNTLDETLSAIRLLTRTLFLVAVLVSFTHQTVSARLGVVG
jgi:hypothetical protein